MKRFLALLAVVMCLAVCMVPMAFADSVVSVSSDVRIAGFAHGFSTLRPCASYSADFYSGVVLFDDITCTSVTVSDAVWVDDDSTTGYFTVVYTITINPISAADVNGRPIVAIPLDWGEGNVRYEWQVSPDMNMRMEDASSNMRMHGLNTATFEYYVDGTNQTMMTFCVSGYEESEMIQEIKIGLKVWDSDATVITSAVPGGKGFGDWLSYPFRIVSAGSGVILMFFSMIMNTNIVGPIIGITGSTLLASAIIGAVR